MKQSDLPPIASNPMAKAELQNWWRAYHGKHGKTCFSDKLHKDTNGRFAAFNNRSLAGTMGEIWKELENSPSDLADMLTSSSQKGAKLKVGDDNGKKNLAINQRKWKGL